MRSLSQNIFFNSINFDGIQNQNESKYENVINPFKHGFSDWKMYFSTEISKYMATDMRNALAIDSCTDKLGLEFASIAN